MSVIFDSGIENDCPPGITPRKVVCLTGMRYVVCNSGERNTAHPTTFELSHHIRVGTHWTIWFGGSIAKTNFGKTFVVASKQEESDDEATPTATLVPPEPKFAASLS